MPHRHTERESRKHSQPKYEETRVVRTVGINWFCVCVCVSGMYGVHKVGDRSQEIPRFDRGGAESGVCEVRYNSDCPHEIP